MWHKSRFYCNRGGKKKELNFNHVKGFYTEFKQKVFQLVQKCTLSTLDMSLFIVTGEFCCLLVRGARVYHSLPCDRVRRAAVDDSYSLEAQENCLLDFTASARTDKLF